MHNNAIVFTIFLIFSGAAILSTVALFTRQSMLVAYMILGALLGPWGFKLVGEPDLVQKTGDIGIIFLLFLLGLHLQPQNLLHMLKKTTIVGTLSSILFAVIGYVVGYLFGYSMLESVIIGAAMMFSSTIIGLKLLPTSVMHHEHTGEVMISVLLLQDFIAIFVLLLLSAAASGRIEIKDIVMLLVSFPGIILFAFGVTRFILLKLFTRFNRIREYMFLLSIAWCLGMAELANQLSLSYEVGAFIAGVSIASSPISSYIAENLKPLRDFFLVMFFFAVGASFDLNYAPLVAVPAIILAVLMLVLKPIIFRVLLLQVSETKQVAWEVGIRLGQISEFSLLVAYYGLTHQLLTPKASYLVQAATIITFIVSSYLVVMRYPTPVALTDRLRRD